MATRSPRVTGAIVLVVLTIGACTGAGSRTASPDSPAATSTPLATPSSATSATPVRAAGALEDLIPAEVGGVRLAKETVHGPDIGELEPQDAANFAKVLENVEGPPEAFAAVSGTGPGLAMSAWRMEGTDGGQLGDAFIAFVLGLGEAEVEDTTIDGKAVKRVSPRNTTPLHIYVTGDVMFVVQAEDDSLLRDAFAALP